MPDGAPFAPQFASVQHRDETAELGMWVFIATEVLLFGGLGADFLPRAQAWLVSRSEVVARAALPAPRAFHSVTSLADGRVLILGGEDAKGELLGQGLIYE